MKERRNQERRRWGRKVTYPFIDSEGVLVTKNRRRKIDRRDDLPEEDQAAQEEETQSSVAGKSKQENKNTSLDISESKVMELEEALQDESKPESSIAASIKDLEEEILDATNIEAVSKEKFEAASKENAPAEKQIAKPKIVEKPAELPEIDTTANGKSNGKDKGVTIELLIKGKKHVLTTDKDTCKVGRDPSCDIIIQNKFVSRMHAQIILKDGKFLVEDSSFNGTYIEFSNGQKIHVSKDEQTLVANGLMSMGKPVDDKSKSVIEFKISQ
ncbi:MAG: FHA domain-containing protein [Gammaproteobacteria bacterium]|nr:MAG: FHA domain-containing protein [Gammaproteobacteria bacterium]